MISFFVALQIDMSWNEYQNNFDKGFELIRLDLKAALLSEKIILLGNLKMINQPF